MISLQYCDECIQMTNHKDGECLKCKVPPNSEDKGVGEGWISVKDRLPEPMQSVIIAGGFGYHNGFNWFTWISHDGPRMIQWEVKHWMPLPKAPTKD